MAFTVPAAKSEGDLIFNKEIGFVNELQRIENLYHNFRILLHHEEAYESLNSLCLMIRPLLSTVEKKKMDELSKHCKVPKDFDRRRNVVFVFNTYKMDTLYNYCTEMMMTHKLQMNKENRRGMMDV